GADGNAVREALLSAAEDGPPYSPFADLNGDGAVTGLDGAMVRMHLLDALPPTAPGDGSSAANDVSMAVGHGLRTVPNNATDDSVVAATNEQAKPSATASTAAAPSFSPNQSPPAAAATLSAPPIHKAPNPIDMATLARERIFESLDEHPIAALSQS